MKLLQHKTATLSKLFGLSLSNDIEIDLSVIDSDEYCRNYTVLNESEQQSTVSTSTAPTSDARMRFKNIINKTEFVVHVQPKLSEVANDQTIHYAAPKVIKYIKCVQPEVDKSNLNKDDWLLYISCNDLSIEDEFQIDNILIISQSRHSEAFGSIVAKLMLFCSSSHVEQLRKSKVQKVHRSWSHLPLTTHDHETRSKGVKRAIGQS